MIGMSLHSPIYPVSVMVTPGQPDIEDASHSHCTLNAQIFSLMYFLGAPRLRMFLSLPDTALKLHAARNALLHPIFVHSLLMYSILSAESWLIINIRLFVGSMIVSLYRYYLQFWLVVLRTCGVMIPFEGIRFVRNVEVQRVVVLILFKWIDMVVSIITSRCSCWPPISVHFLRTAIVRTLPFNLTTLSVF